MKKLFIIFAALFISVMASAQTVGVVNTITADTINAVETKNFTLPKMTGKYESINIQSLYTQLGGTTDGTALLKVSVDGTSWNTFIDDNYDEVFFRGDDDTLTINNADVWNIEIKNPTYPYYRIAATGTANDTTLVTVKYIIKR